MTPGTLITLEGIDGAGKTTLAVAMAAALRERGVAAELLREPGGVRVSERIRELVSDPGERIGARAEALLYAAARAQLVQERLAPALAGGAFVLLDRFVDSSLVYQGVGRELGVAQVAQVNAFATAGLVPDRTLLLAIDPARARARSRAREAAPDRIETEDAAFFARIVDGYAQLAADEPERIRVLDAKLGEAGLLAAALAAIDDLVD